MPTDLEAVYMCKYVSAKSGTLTGGWKFKRYLGKKKGKKFIGLYYKKSTKEYCIANKGTSPKNFSDWKNNVQQPIGKSKDMKLSIKEAKKFVKKHKKREITFIGHSKGGAEAAANAVATNRNCITFNPAVVNYKKYNLNPYRYTAHMTTYIVQGDILNTLEGGFRGFSGKIIYLPKQYGKGWYYGGGLSVAFGVKNHLLDAVEKALKSIQGGGGGGGSW